MALCARPATDTSSRACRFTRKRHYYQLSPTNKARAACRTSACCSWESWPSRPGTRPGVTRSGTRVSPASRRANRAQFERRRGRSSAARAQARSNRAQRERRRGESSAARAQPRFREARARSATAKSIHGESGDKGGADKHRVDICRSGRSPPWFPSGRAVVVDRLGDFGGARVGPVRNNRATRHRGASLLVSADLRCTCVSGAILILTGRLSAPQPVIREPRPRNR